MTSSSIRLFVTGGTFDKEYNELDGALFFRDTHVPEMLRLGRCLLAVEVSTLMMVDSLEMTPDQRAAVVSQCRDAAESQIVITHGTDRLIETADALRQANLDKTIVLTGAMIPYKFSSSDGMFNLGSALAFVQALPPGVYVAMNGRCFPAGQVRKNREKGIFEAV